MNKELLFTFKTDISTLEIPQELNNPFGSHIPNIARLAALEFQKYITTASQDWEHDFNTEKGKMFGILVVRQENGAYGYLGTISGKLLGRTTCDRFIPSVFDDSTDDYFINRGMKELSEIGKQIKASDTQSEIDALRKSRKLKSHALQQRLFENYEFLNTKGESKNVLQIFACSSHGHPPAAAGECAAPKLLNYALSQKLNPIAVAEFWWGNPPKNKERIHQHHYPACKNKCRPILEYMLDDNTLYDQAKEL